MSISTDSHCKEKKEQGPFDTLPDELVLQIFSHLPPQDIACYVSKVCLRWNSIAKEPVLWERAILEYNEIQYLEFQETIQFAPQIAEVHINMFRIMNDDTIKAILFGCKMIKYLSFYPGPGMSVNTKFNILRLYQENLIELDMFLDDSYLTSSETTEIFWKILDEISNLKVLTFRGLVSSGLFENGFFQTRFSKLESLDISTLTIIFQENNYTLYEGSRLNSWQNFILYILEHKAQNMKKLSLPAGVFDLSTVNILENKFMCFKIENLKICEAGLRIVQKLECLKVLHVVGLSPKNLDSLRIFAGFQYKLLYDWINKSTQFFSVKELTLENITEDERRLTINLLQACTNLECLTVSSGYQSSAHLANLISKSPSLKKLNIHRMPCLKSKHLETIMCHLPNLELLNLQNNTLTDGILQFYVDNVQNKMQNLKLICDWGYWSINGGNPWCGQTQSCSVSNSIKFPTKPATSCHSPGHDDRAKVTQMLDALTDYEDDD